MQNTRERLRKHGDLLKIIALLCLIWWLEPHLYTVSDACTDIMHHLKNWKEK